MFSVILTNPHSTLPIWDMICLRFKSIEIYNPQRLSDRDLLKVMTQIYQLPPEELLRPEGKAVSDFLGEGQSGDFIKMQKSARES